MSLNADILSVYTDEIIALSETTRTPKRLARADLDARAISPVCGSEVMIELEIEGGKIKDIGYDVEACALTRAAVAVLAQAAIGKTREDIARAGEQMHAMLQGAGAPDGAFSRLGLLGAVKDYPARHNALMLPFVRVDALWRSGLAGSIPSAVCFVAAGLFLFASARRIFGSPAAGVAAAALFALNPNMLYLQSIAMTEAAFAASVAGLLYFSVRFRETQGWGPFWGRRSRPAPERSPATRAGSCCPSRRRISSSPPGAAAWP